MLILDEKTGEVADKDISRSNCPFRSITDLKRDLYHFGEDYEEGSTLTQAEQYVPIIKMVEKMLRGEDVEFIKQLLEPAKPAMPDLDDQALNDALDGVIPNDADPIDLYAMANLSTETQAEQAVNEPSDASSSCGEVAPEHTKATQEALE